MQDYPTTHLVALICAISPALADNANSPSERFIRETIEINNSYNETLEQLLSQQISVTEGVEELNVLAHALEELVLHYEELSSEQLARVNELMANPATAKLMEQQLNKAQKLTAKLKAHKYLNSSELQKACEQFEDIAK